MATSFVVLASASPRRAELLRQSGVLAHVMPVEIDEKPRKHETPSEFARRMAQEKMNAALHQAPPEAFVLTADTVVATGRHVIDKARSPEDVRAALHALSGRGHRVYTAVGCRSPISGKASYRLSETRITFKRLSEVEIERYVQSGEGLGKAGGYALQGSAEGFVEKLCGSVSGVIGLPMCETIKLLTGGGYVFERPGAAT